jgi:hypothetical protein
VPILKSKAGEFQALGDLSHEIIGGLTPLLEVTPFSEFADSTKTTDALIEGLPERIEKSWGPGRRLFIDGRMVEEDTLTDESEPIAALLTGCRERGIHAIPVTGLRRVTEYQEAVAAALMEDQRGVCLRLASDDLSETEEMEPELSEVLAKLGCAPEDVDLLIDYGPITEDIRKTIQVALIAQINALPLLREWRSLTFAASAFPQNLAQLDRGALAMIPRSEWTIWTYLARHKARIGRLPDFGDYAVAHPDVVDVDPRLMRMSPNIRYAHDESWIVAKGAALPRKSDTKRNPPSREQYPALCRAIVESEYWRGADYSRGDTFIAQCAEGSGATGNATTWRRVGTDHHLTTVVRQLASRRAL